MMYGRFTIKVSAVDQVALTISRCIFFISAQGHAPRRIRPRLGAWSLVAPLCDNPSTHNHRTRYSAIHDTVMICRCIVDESSISTSKPMIQSSAYKLFSIQLFLADNANLYQIDFEFDYRTLKSYRKDFRQEPIA